MSVHTKGRALKALPVSFIFICTCSVTIDWLTGIEGKDEDTHTQRDTCIHTHIAAKLL